jgi:hypothetical protein
MRSSVKWKSRLLLCCGMWRRVHLYTNANVWKELTDSVLQLEKKKKKRQQVPKMRWNLKYCTVRQYFGFTHFNLYPSTVIDKNASVCQHAFLPLLYIVKMSVCLLQTLLVWSRDHTSYSYISAIHLTAQTASIAVTWPLVTTSIVKAFTKFVRVLGQLHT